ASAIMGVAVNGMHFTGMAAMHVYRSSTPMSMGGASAESFLLPLIIGISVISFVLTATIALAPTEAEINEDAELMRKIDTMRAQPPVVVQPVITSTQQRPSSGRYFTSQDRGQGDPQLPE